MVCKVVEGRMKMNVVMALGLVNGGCDITEVFDFKELLSGLLRDLNPNTR
jgi:hypothetical protein